MNSLIKDKKCLICQKPVQLDFRSFCSSRCQKIDLGRWFNECYVVQNDENSDYVEISEVPPDQEN